MRFLFVIVLLVDPTIFDGVQGNVIRNDLHAENGTTNEFETFFNAVESENVDLVKSLVENVTNINFIDEHFKITPLQLAVLYNNTQIAKILIKHGADVNVESEACKTISDIYVNGFIFHLENGPKVNEKKCRIDTPLFNAARFGNTELVNILIEHGADLNSLNMCFYEAALNGHFVICDILTAHGADVNAFVDINGYKTLPLEAAIVYGLNEMMEYLIEHGANITAEAIDKTTPLENAAISGNLEACKILIAHGAHISNETFTHLLTIPTRFGTKEFFEYLIEQGANVNAEGVEKRTALHWAFYFGNEEVKKVLIDHGANENAKDNDNKTPSEMNTEEGKRMKAEAVAEMNKIKQRVQRTPKA